MQDAAGSLVALDGVGVFTAMATPAVLLLANAMLILSTIQRLQVPLMIGALGAGAVGWVAGAGVTPGRARVFRGVPEAL